MVDIEASVTPQQEQVLKLYRLFQHQPPTIRSYVPLTWRRQIMSVVATGAGAIFCFSIGVAPAGYMVIGALLNDLEQFLRAVYIWPVLRRIIDWPAVEKLLSVESPRRDT